MRGSNTFVLLLLGCLSLAAQKTTYSELNDFNGIKVFDRIEVTLVKSDANRLEVTGEDKDNIEIVNKGGILKIRTHIKNFIDGNNAKAILYYKTPLTLIDVNESAKVISGETLKSDDLVVHAQEGGVADLTLDVKSISLKAISGGDITLAGTAGSQDVTVNAGGKVHCEKLDTRTSTVSVRAGGRADVKASDKVTAKVRAGGSIYIYGNPKEVVKDKVLGGKIEIVQK